MLVYRGFQDKSLKPKKRAIAIGVFDGVHRAHRRLLGRLKREAQKHRLSSMVITFDPHPARVLGRGKPHPAILMSLSRRLDFFKRLGVHEVLVVPFTRKFSRLSRESFFERLLIDALGMKSLTAGHDFCFGKNAGGDASYLKKRCRERGIRFFLIRAIRCEGDVISSTKIRACIEAGDLKKASAMLGRPVSAVGTVVRGRGRGASLGFPTANLNLHHEAAPPTGVYAVYGYVGEKKLKGVLHIGNRPTFGDDKSVEVHFIGFDQKLYGRDVELFFVKKLRDVKRFSGAPALRRAIQGDIQTALKLLPGR